MNNINDKISDLFEEMRRQVPLVHCMTNYVTVNDCANALLSVGASPIMSDDIEDVKDIVSISKALVINIGTLNKRTIESMIVAGKEAVRLGIPVVFDPVGAGASGLRNETTKRVLSEIQVSVIRGNLSEISYCAGLSASTKGVDSSDADKKNDITDAAIRTAKAYSCIAAVTGETDVITDGKKIIKIKNGDAVMSKVSGTGCMASVLVGAFAGASQDKLYAAAAGVLSMSLAGEIAKEKCYGTGSLRVAIIDELGRIDRDVILRRAKIYEE